MKSQITTMDRRHGRVSLQLPEKSPTEKGNPMHPNAQQRSAILNTLYAAREARPGNGWLSERDIKDAHGDIAFALDVLVETGLIRQDGYRYRITGAGVVSAEA